MTGVPGVDEQDDVPLVEPNELGDGLSGEIGNSRDGLTVEAVEEGEM